MVVTAPSALTMRVSWLGADGKDLRPIDEARSCCSSGCSGVLMRARFFIEYLEVLPSVYAFADHIGQNMDQQGVWPALHVVNDEAPQPSPTGSQPSKQRLRDPSDRPQPCRLVSAHQAEERERKHQVGATWRFFGSGDGPGAQFNAPPGKNAFERYRIFVGSHAKPPCATENEKSPQAGALHRSRRDQRDCRNSFAPACVCPISAERASPSFRLASRFPEEPHFSEFLRVLVIPH